MQVKQVSNPQNNGYYQFDAENVNAFDVEEPEVPVYAFNLIKLNPGITQGNFICCILHSMIMIFGFALAGSMQPMILLDKKYYNVEENRTGTIMSLVLVIQLIVKVLVSVPYGHYSDKLGRKPMILYGGFNYFLSCILVPIMPNIFPGLILAKILLANGTSALHCVPLLADYVADETKGKAIGFSAMTFGVAAISSNLFLKFLLKREASLGLCYVIGGIVILIFLSLNTLGLKGGDYYKKKSNESSDKDAKNVSIKDNMKEALAIFQGNGWLMIALVLQILGSSDFFIFFTFMTLYVKSMFPPGTADVVTNLAVNNLQTTVLVPSFICNIIYGYFLDRQNRALLTAYFALTGGALSFILMSLSNAPSDWRLSVSAILFGSTIPGLFVITGYLSIKNFPAEKRGIMIGFTGVIGYVGYFVIALGGGIINDHWRKDGAFLICAILLVVAIGLVTMIYRTKIAGRGQS